MEKEIEELVPIINSAIMCYATMTGSDVVKIEGSYEDVQKYMYASDTLYKRLNEASLILDRLKRGQ